MPMCSTSSAGCAHFNDARTGPDEKAGFYGLDLYSLHASIDAVLAYLRRVDPEAAERARERYACFDQYGSDPQSYGYATTTRLGPSCEAEVVAQLVEMRRMSGELARHDGRLAADDQFFAEQNARLVANAEQYYRAMFGSRVSSWNLRDLHMAETLDALVAFLRPRVQTPKIVVWAHNSHLGDARATELGRSGELNVGQIARQRYGDEAVLVGFSTYAGTVTAASDWDEPAERKIVRPGLRGSYEALFHDVEMPNFLLFPDRTRELRAALDHARLQRAIGVIYRPETERQSHYFHTHLPAQFDAVLHYDQTRAVEPLERTAVWERGRGTGNVSEHDVAAAHCRPPTIGDRQPAANDLTRLTMSTTTNAIVADSHVRLPVGPVTLDGDLSIPAGATSLVLFAHGSGSSRLSPRNIQVARGLQEAGLATLLFDLLTQEEGAEDAFTGHLRFDIELLARRLLGVTDLVANGFGGRAWRVGYFGASTGAAAALIAASRRPETVHAVVSRGGRPDLAGSALSAVQAPTLLIVGEYDRVVIDLNRDAFERLWCIKRLDIVPRATHLFEEPGALEEVTRLARGWFEHHLMNAAAQTTHSP